MGINPSLPAPKGPPIPRPRPERPPRPEDLPNAAFTDERFKSVQQRIAGPKPDLPPPFTDERFKGALLAGHRRQLEDWHDPFSEQADESLLNYTPELQRSDTSGLAFNVKLLSENFFSTLEGLGNGTIRPNNFEQRLFAQIFARKPELLEKKDGIRQSFTLFDERRGNINPAKMAKAHAGFFEGLGEYILGDFEGNQAERDELIEGMTKDYLALAVKTHELRHVTFKKTKYQEFFDDRGIRGSANYLTPRGYPTNLSAEEEFNRAMDWFYAPDAMKQTVLAQQVAHGVLQGRKVQTTKLLERLYKLYAVSDIKEMEEL